MTTLGHPVWFLPTVLKLVNTTSYKKEIWDYVKKIVT